MESSSKILEGERHALFQSGCDVRRGPCARRLRQQRFGQQVVDELFRKLADARRRLQGRRACRVRQGEVVPPRADGARRRADRPGDPREPAEPGDGGEEGRSRGARRPGVLQAGLPREPAHGLARRCVEQVRSSAVRAAGLRRRCRRPWHRRVERRRDGRPHDGSAFRRDDPSRPRWFAYGDLQGRSRPRDHHAAAAARMGRPPHGDAGRQDLSGDESWQRRQACHRVVAPPA